MKGVPQMQFECGYCNDWNRDHPQESPRASCGPCDVCKAPGHVGAHPRQPVSLCLCEKHWSELTDDGYHFETYHLIYVLIVVIFVAVTYPIVARFF